MGTKWGRNGEELEAECVLWPLMDGIDLAEIVTELSKKDGLFAELAFGFLGWEDGLQPWEVHNEDDLVGDMIGVKRARRKFAGRDEQIKGKLCDSHAVDDFLGLVMRQFLCCMPIDDNGNFGCIWYVLVMTDRRKA